MHSCQRWFKRFQWQRWWASCRRWLSWTAQESAVQQCHLHPGRQMFEMVWSQKFQTNLPESRRSSRWIWQIQSQLPKIPIHFSQLTIEWPCHVGGNGKLLSYLVDEHLAPIRFINVNCVHLAKHLGDEKIVIGTLMDNEHCVFFEIFDWQIWSSWSICLAHGIDPFGDF